jgi:hypothetical protein
VGNVCGGSVKDIDGFNIGNVKERSIVINDGKIVSVNK